MVEYRVAVEHLSQAVHDADLSLDFSPQAIEIVHAGQVDMHANPEMALHLSSVQTFVWRQKTGRVTWVWANLQICNPRRMRVHGQHADGHGMFDIRIKAYSDLPNVPAAVAS